MSIHYKVATVELLLTVRVISVVSAQGKAQALDRARDKLKEIIMPAGAVVQITEDATSISWST
jgi:hypothetical protein